MSVLVSPFTSPYTRSNTAMPANPHETMSVLVPVPPSPSNVAMPAESAEDWTAVGGGGFLPGLYRPKRSIKKQKKKKVVEYWVDHCENSACSFPWGHAGLCSHQIVHTRTRNATHIAPTYPYFDLNDSDSD